METQPCYTEILVDYEYSPHFSSGIVGSKRHARELENQPTRERRDAAVREKYKTPLRLPFSHGSIFTRAHISLTLLSLRKYSWDYTCSL